jgi:phenylacetate-coenzyme A ligase PaaK-like adenylate-forming protein
MQLPDTGIFKQDLNFSQKALELFHFQYAHNALYKRFTDALNCDAAKVNAIGEIPFLPISFFKQFPVTTTNFEPQVIFKSSGTTGMATSQHLVKDKNLYEESFMTAFEQFYGPVEDYCILGLLPSYLERSSSSLVYMVQHMIEVSKHPLNGFYLYNFEELFETLQQLQATGQKTLLIGVTYALLDFADVFPIQLNNTIIMETGGMKGRKKELLRAEVHNLLKKAFGVDQIHSEYGMTELLSQAYSSREGFFRTPSWMKVVLREEDDPLAIITQTQKQVSGAINVIDLANVYSCCFIATDDVGRLHPDGSFEILGRMDQSDIRGCSLLAI